MGRLAQRRPAPTRLRRQRRPPAAPALGHGGPDLRLRRPEPGAILAAARAGASYLTSGPVLLLRDPAPGARLPADADAVSLTVADLPGPADVYLVADGARVARRSLRGDGDLRLPLPGGGVRWCRVELYAQGRDVPLALSNAIFPA